MDITYVVDKGVAKRAPFFNCTQLDYICSLIDG